MSVEVDNELLIAYEAHRTVTGMAQDQHHHEAARIATNHAASVLQHGFASRAGLGCS